jgi:hypothetical protein
LFCIVANDFFSFFCIFVMLALLDLLLDLLEQDASSSFVRPLLVLLLDFFLLGQNDEGCPFFLQW